MAELMERMVIQGFCMERCQTWGGNRLPGSVEVKMLELDWVNQEYKRTGKGLSHCDTCTGKPLV